MSRREAANHVKAGGRHFLLRLPPSDALCNIITCGRPQTTNFKSHRQEIACTTRRDAANNDFVCEHIISSFEECARVLCNVCRAVESSNAPEDVPTCRYSMRKHRAAKAPEQVGAVHLNTTSIQKHCRDLCSHNESVNTGLSKTFQKRLRPLKS